MREIFLRRGLGRLAPLVMALGVFLFHLPKLADRPMHTDEAVHAVKLGMLLKTGKYEYNPREFHGPTLYYLTLPVMAMIHARSLPEIPDERPLRLVTVICGAALVGSIAVAVPELGFLAVFFGAVLIGLSPPFAFYGRYYIQEVPFVLFSLLFLWGLGRSLATGRLRYTIAAGLFLGAAMATKETWIIVVGVAALSAILIHLTPEWRRIRELQWKNLAGQIAVMTFVSVAVATLLLTNFFRNPAAAFGLWDSIAGYMTRGITGDSSTFGAAVHIHPWYYYMELLWQPHNTHLLETIGQRATILLGLTGGIFIFIRWQTTPATWRFLALFAILITACYCAIPYKTPWNALLPLATWILLAAFAVSSGFHMISNGPWRTSVAIIFLTISAALCHETWLLTLRNPADTRNPFAYSPTVPGINRLVSRIDQMAAIDPQHNNLTIYVVAPENDYWPLPWYLRKYENVGYFTTTPASFDTASVLIKIAPDDAEPGLPETEWQSEYFGLRPDVLMQVYIRKTLWDAFIKTQLEPTV